MAAGAPRSGRSQLLRTIAAALALAHSCADLHLYGIDCGNGALRALTDLPHCGAVVTRTETERAVRLLGRLAAEVSRRQELLAEGGFADITEQRAATTGGERLPHVVVLLDRWEGFTATLGEVDHGSLTDVITRILGEGASVGVHLVMTGDRSLLAGRISAMCEQKLAFKLAEKDDYGLIGLRPRDMPDDVAAGAGVPGRFRRGSAGGAARRRTPPGRGRRRRCGPSPPRAQRGTRRSSPRGGRSGWTCCRRGSRSRKPGRCGPPRPGRCGGWSAWAATCWPASGPDLAVGVPVLHRGRAREVGAVDDPARRWRGRSWPGGRR